jgi:Flp pilus assembly protein TadD
MLPFEEAIEKLKLVLKQDPENPDLWCSLGVALIELKKYDEAVEKFEKAAELSPQLPSAWYGWGIALKALGEDEAAAEKIKTAMEMDQDSAKNPSKPKK